MWRVADLDRCVKVRGRRPFVIEGVLLLDALDQIGRSPDFLIFVDDPDRKRGRPVYDDLVDKREFSLANQIARYFGRRLIARGAARKQMPVSHLRHPLGAREVALKSSSRAIRLLLRVSVQDDPRDLAPISTFRISIKHAHMGDDVLLIIDGERWTRGRQIGDVWNDSRHGRPRDASWGRLGSFPRFASLA